DAVPGILIVDDSPGTIDFLIGLLGEYDISVAVDGKGALEQIAQEIPDLILLDVNMPEMDGYEVCLIIKSNPNTKDIPVLFLSANTDADSVVKGFDAGGVDYIAKPYHPQEILARIGTHIKLKQLRDKLEKMAYEDSMTGISNRRRFFDKAGDLFAGRRSADLPFCLFAIDMDKFKNINDTYGHNVGDEVIKKFVSIVKKELKEEDCFARFGGDEFILMMTRTNSEKAMDVLKRIQKNTSETHQLLGNSVNFSISAGLAEVKDFNENIDEVIRRADRNLYKEKQRKLNSSRDYYRSR
ncbi:MAG: diguanylate cyclase, partial [Campylobacterota bacterium]|nr:diguanylate cyclase [Campylobacterota bacterium]